MRCLSSLALIAPILLAGLAGCATVALPVGRDYAQGAFGGFALDETTVDEAEAVLGPPMRVSSVQTVAKPTSTLVQPGTTMTLTTLNYYFAPNGLGQPRERHPAKTATLVFLGGYLAAYDLTNAIPGETSPPIDETRLSALHQGETTRAQAIALFGTPAGQLLHTFDALRGTSEIVYGWARQEGGTVSLRMLKIVFDTTGRLSTYNILDNSFPVGGTPLLLPGPQNRPGGQGMPVPHTPMPRPDLDHT